MGRASLTRASPHHVLVPVLLQNAGHGLGVGAAQRRAHVHTPALHERARAHLVLSTFAPADAEA